MKRNILGIEKDNDAQITNEDIANKKTIITANKNDNEEPSGSFKCLLKVRDFGKQNFINDNEKIADISDIGNKKNEIPKEKNNAKGLIRVRQFNTNVFNETDDDQKVIDNEYNKNNDDNGEPSRSLKMPSLLKYNKSDTYDQTIIIDNKMTTKSKHYNEELSASFKRGLLRVRKLGVNDNENSHENQNLSYTNKIGNTFSVYSENEDDIRDSNNSVNITPLKNQEYDINTFSCHESKDIDKEKITTIEIKINKDGEEGSDAFKSDLHRDEEHYNNYIERYGVIRNDTYIEPSREPLSMAGNTSVSSDVHGQRIPETNNDISDENIASEQNVNTNEGIMHSLGIVLPSISCNQDPEETENIIGATVTIKQEINDTGWEEMNRAKKLQRHGTESSYNMNIDTYGLPNQFEPQPGPSGCYSECNNQYPYFTNTATTSSHNMEYNLPINIKQEPEESPEMEDITGNISFNTSIPEILMDNSSYNDDMENDSSYNFEDGSSNQNYNINKWEKKISFKNKCKVSVEINGRVLDGLIDIKSPITVIKKSVGAQLGLKPHDDVASSDMESTTNETYVDEIKVNEKIIRKVNMLMVESATADCIIGQNILNDFAGVFIYIGGPRSPLILHNTNDNIEIDQDKETSNESVT